MRALAWSGVIGRRAHLACAVVSALEVSAVLALLAVGSACQLGTVSSDSRFEEIEVSIRGHSEIANDGRPRFLSRESVPGLCIQAAPRQDTTQWQIAIGNAVRSPMDRMGRTICFELESPTKFPQILTIRAELVDSYDDRRHHLQDIDVEFAQPDPNFLKLQTRFADLMSSRGDLSTNQLERQLRDLHIEAARETFPILALRTQLVRAFFLRRTGRRELQRLAAELLAERPPWLDTPHADVWAAQHAYERASLLLETDPDTSETWEALREAGDRYGQVADPRRITVVMKQADLLSISGSPRTGRERLREAIEECGSTGCEARFLGAAENTLTWLTLQDPEATSAEIRAAVRIARSGVQELAASKASLEKANAWVNLAFALARANEDPSQSVAETEMLLTTIVAEPERRQWISRWGRLALATFALGQREFDQAQTLCEELQRDAKTPDLASRAMGCLASVYRVHGKLAAAYATLQRAIVLEELADLEAFSWQNLSGTAQLRHHLKLAAGLAVELDRPEEAWSFLEALERPQVRSSRGCAGLETAEQRSDWNRLLLDLISIEGPASQDLREVRRQIQPQLKLEIQRQLQIRSGCSITQAAYTSPSVDFRAFSVGDRLTLLRRSDSGTIETYRTTDFDAEELADTLTRLDSAVQTQTTGSRSWCDLTGTLSIALVPNSADLGRQTRFALHGSLQQVPLGALPIPGSEAREFLASRTVVILRPARSNLVPTSAVGVDSESPDRLRRPLFVIDPTGNLPGTNAAVERYRSLFPAAEILDNQRASRSNVAAALQGARWLHVGAHGELDPAFPELSRVRLADGATPIAEWAEQASGLEFANLSMCASGRWSSFAESVRHGPAGLFAEHGSAWVIAARADLPNPVALEFNGRFYDRIADGADVPDAFRDALESVRSRFPPEKWASLLLVQGGA